MTLRMKVTKIVKLLKLRMLLAPLMHQKPILLQMTKQTFQTLLILNNKYTEHQNVLLDWKVNHLSRLDQFNSQTLLDWIILLAN